jgi:hypothetical protein
LLETAARMLGPLNVNGPVSPLVATGHQSFWNNMFPLYYNCEAGSGGRIQGTTAPPQAHRGPNRLRQEISDSGLFVVAHYHGERGGSRLVLSIVFTASLWNCG